MKKVRIDVVDHVVLMPMRIKTQWEGDKLIAVMPAWRLPTGLVVEGDYMADALDKLERQMRQYWGAPSNVKVSGDEQGA
jgi:hypothetical protein